MPPTSGSISSAPQDSFGPFRVIRQLGEGATAAVFLAQHIDFPQRVAIKVFHPALDGQVPTGNREADVLARLDHRRKVRVIDSGVSATGGRYLAMEFVDGLPIDRFCG
ncbi:MAG: hypothetical protein M3Y57_13280 [Acidobacteriota bacterium]|nr:hypothetical protein [Acidobacteriota bacterium]